MSSRTRGRLPRDGASGRRYRASDGARGPTPMAMPPRSAAATALRHRSHRHPHTGATRPRPDMVDNHSQRRALVQPRSGAISIAIAPWTTRSVRRRRDGVGHSRLKRLDLVRGHATIVHRQAERLLFQPGTGVSARARRIGSAAARAARAGSGRWIRRWLRPYDSSRPLVPT